MAFSPIFQRPFSATFDRLAVAAAAGNGLLNALIAYWPGNEASGDLLDLHTNALHLTDTNTVTNAAGKVYATARQYTAAKFERHTRPSETLLNASNDFTIAAWVYLDSKPTFAHIFSKWLPTAGGRSHLLRYNGGATDRFYFEVRNAADTAYGNVTANTFGAVSTGTWYLVIVSHNDSANQLTISINAGATDTASWSQGVLSGTGSLQIGSQINSDTDTYYWNGRIGPVAMWKSAAGGGGVLSSSQRSALWNAGNGLAYANFTT